MKKIIIGVFVFIVVMLIIVTPVYAKQGISGFKMNQRTSLLMCCNHKYDPNGFLGRMLELDIYYRFKPVNPCLCREKESLVTIDICGPVMMMKKRLCECTMAEK